MTRDRLAVIVAVWRHGRELAPTLRSLDLARRVAESEFDITIHVVCSVARSAVAQAVVQRMGARAVHLHVVDDATVTPMGLQAHAVAVTDAIHLAFLGAGDLVSTEWLLDAARLCRGSGEDPMVVRPAVVVTFGKRSGVWPQARWPEESSAALLLATTDPWAGPVALTRSVLERVPLAHRTSEPIAQRVWHANLVQSGTRQEVTPTGVGFVRVWNEAAPWEVASRPLIGRIGLLLNRQLAVEALPPTQWRTVRPEHAALRGAGRAIRALVVRFRRVMPKIASRPDWIHNAAFIDAWRRQNELEPLIPYPRPDVARWYEQWGKPWPRSYQSEASAYWYLVRALPERVDYVFFAPWLQTGGGDNVLMQYIAAIRRLDPTGSIVLVTTETDASTRLCELGGGIVVIELRDLMRGGIPRQALVERIVPQLLGQFRPHTIHAFNSTIAFDVIERFGESLAQNSSIFLSTFAIDRTSDGERTSVLFLRNGPFLDPVEAVLVDSERFVERVTGELGYDPHAFVVQRQAVSRLEHAIDSRDRALEVSPKRPLRVLWAARFDIPKRLDILASVATEVARRMLPVEIEVYGESVMGDPNAAAALVRLRAAGVQVRPAYRAVDGLPTTNFDVFLMTSEWEGVPSTLLEAMAAGLPCIAPLVGGVGEVLNDRTGYPVHAFDDIASYVEAITQVIADREEARTRAIAARGFVERFYSEAHFDQQLQQLPGYLRGGPAPRHDRREPVNDV